MSLQQHIAAMEYGEAVLKGMGYDQPALWAILVEAMANTSPAMSMSEYAIGQALANEIDRYEEGPAQYVAKWNDTAYNVLALEKPPIEGLGEVPDYFAAAYSFRDVPSIHDDWLAFAVDIEGYDIARLLGLTFEDIGEVARQRYSENGASRGTIVDLRLVLFYEAVNFPRGEDLSDAPSYAAYIESLLHALAVAHQAYLAKDPAE